MYFCIRDDDTSFFTSPDELEQAYGEITQWGPVSLAVVPFHRAGTSKAVPEKFRGRWTVHPLHENTELVMYLRQRVSEGRFEIMLHGYYHDDAERAFEFASGRDLTERVAKGKKYLEELLHTKIRVFVAPKNVIARKGLRALAREHLHLAGTTGVRSGWPLLSRKTWQLWAKLRDWQKNGGLGVPWILDLNDHRELSGVAITPTSSFESNKVLFEHTASISGVFCVFTHYWELPALSQHNDDPSVGQHLRYFVERARSEPRILWRSVGDTLTQAPAVI
jgi:predicted deacetylase